MRPTIKRLAAVAAGIGLTVRVPAPICEVMEGEVFAKRLRRRVSGGDHCRPESWVWMGERVNFERLRATRSTGSSQLDHHGLEPCFYLRPRTSATTHPDRYWLYKGSLGRINSTADPHVGLGSAAQ